MHQSFWACVYSIVGHNGASAQGKNDNDYYSWLLPEEISGLKSGDYTFVSVCKYLAVEAPSLSPSNSVWVSRSNTNSGETLNVEGLQRHNVTHVTHFSKNLQSSFWIKCPTTVAPNQKFPVASHFQMIKHSLELWSLPQPSRDVKHS